MRKRLTARSVESAKALNGQRTDVFDTTVPGLALRVSPSGSKSWAVLFRSRGRLRRLTIGDAKTIGLAEAREEAREAIRAAAKGGDPATEKKRRRGAKTIDDLIPDFIERYAKKRNRTSFMRIAMRLICERMPTPIPPHKASPHARRYRNLGLC